VLCVIVSKRVDDGTGQLQPIGLSVGKINESSNLDRVVPYQMLYVSDNAHLMASHVAKFYEATLPHPKVIGANKLQFKPVFFTSL